MEGWPRGAVRFFWMLGVLGIVAGLALAFSAGTVHVDSIAGVGLGMAIRASIALTFLAPVSLGAYGLLSRGRRSTPAFIFGAAAFCYVTFATALPTMEYERAVADLGADVVTEQMPHLPD